MYHKSPAYKAFYAFNLVLIGILSLACVLPLIHILAVSFSGKAAATANLVAFWPVDFNTEAYQKTFGNENFLSSIWVSVKRVVFGTALGMLVTLITAYPLSKGSDTFRGRDGYMWFLLITMLFSGGLVPMYVLMSEIGLLGSFWALILPGLVAVFNIVLLMNFFRNVPKELEESAFLDGAGYLAALFHIFLPISMPAIATLSLFNIVGHWNSWFDGMIYMNESSQWPLATLLQAILVQVDFTKLSASPGDLANLADRTVKASQIFIGSLPVLAVYPFLQKYFVKGIVLGAVKE